MIIINKEFINFSRYDYKYRKIMSNIPTLIQVTPQPHLANHLFLQHSIIDEILSYINVGNLDHFVSVILQNDAMLEVFQTCLLL